jgi:hypothetical protein
MKKEQEKIRKELEGPSPFLSQLKETGRPEGFDVPPTYFRELPDRVLERVKKGEPAAASQSPWWPRLAEALSRLLQPRYAAGLATVGALIISGLLIFDQTDSPPSSANMFSTLTPEEVNAYIQSNLEEFEEEMVIEAAEEYQELSLLPSTTLDEEDLEEYYEELLREMDEESIEELL